VKQEPIKPDALARLVILCLLQDGNVGFCSLTKTTSTTQPKFKLLLLLEVDKILALANNM